MYSEPLLGELLPAGEAYVDELRWVFEVTVNKRPGFDENANFRSGSDLVRMEPPYTFSRLNASHVGTRLNAPWIPPGTVVAHVLSNIEMRMSHPATASVRQQWFRIGDQLIFWGFQFGEEGDSYDASVIAASLELVSSSAHFALWDVGQEISGRGIRPETKVAVVHSPSRITMTRSATHTGDTRIHLGSMSGGHVGHQMNEGTAPDGRKVNAGFYGRGGGPDGRTDGICAHQAGAGSGVGISYSWLANRPYLYRRFRSPVQIYGDSSALHPPGSVGTRPSDVVWRSTITDLATGNEQTIADCIVRHAKPHNPIHGLVFWSEDFEPTTDCDGEYLYPAPYEARWANIQYRRFGDSNWYSVNRYKVHHALRDGRLPSNADIFVTPRGVHQKVGTPRRTAENAILVDDSPVVAVVGVRTYNNTSNPDSFAVDGGAVTPWDRVLCAMAVPASAAVTSLPSGWTLLVDGNEGRHGPSEVAPKLYLFERQVASVLSPTFSSEDPCDWVVAMIRYRVPARPSQTAPAVAGSVRSSVNAHGDRQWEAPAFKRTRASSRVLVVVASQSLGPTACALSVSGDESTTYCLVSAPGDAAGTEASLLGMFVGTEADVDSNDLVRAKDGMSREPQHYTAVQVEL